MVTASILESTKLALSVPTDYDEYDQVIIMHINTALSILNQVGCGPVQGFQIFDATATWDDLLVGDLLMNMAKTYVYLQVRVFFDPPASSFATTMMNDQLKEMQVRISILHDARMAELEANANAPVL